MLPLPALRRLSGARVALDARTPTLPGDFLDVSVDGDRPSAVSLVPHRRDWLDLPARAQDGAVITWRLARTATVDGLWVAARPEWSRAAAAAAAVALLTFVIASTRPRAPAIGLGLWTVGLVSLASVPGWILLAWPGGSAVARLLAPSVLALAGLVLAIRPPAERRAAFRLALLIGAAIFGCWVRAFFLPSAGSWDVDYWRTAMVEAATHGVAGAYGGADDVPPGHLLAQLRGRERVSAPNDLGRAIVVNYPPLAVALWAASARVVAGRAGRLEPIEADALASKLPSLAGDLAAVAVLLWIHRRRPWRAAALAAVYWATPLSWLNSAVQGYQDGAYAPLLVIALVAAAHGLGFWAGAALGAAAMIKLPALIAAPAVAGALIAGSGVPLAAKRVALAAGGGLAVLAATFAPFARAGTLAAAIVHVNSIWLPGPLSGGSPNLWWLAGHFASVAGGGSAFGRVAFVRHDRLPAAYAIGRVLWLASAMAVVALQRRRPGLRPALLGAATLFFTYAMLATGVYENHVHAMFLLLLAGGLVTRRCRVVTAAAAAVYVLDVLAMSGLGRFYTMRYLLLAPWTPLFDRLRMGLGFDLTLVLAVVNLALLAAWCTGLPFALAATDEVSDDASDDASDAAYRRAQPVA
jgi:hypothetical protein